MISELEMKQNILLGDLVFELATALSERINMRCIINTDKAVARVKSIKSKKSYSCGTVSDKDFRFRCDAGNKNLPCSCRK